MRWPLPLLALGCNPDLSAAEKRQKDLELELRDLEAEIDTLRAALEEAGVQVAAPKTPRGKARKSRKSRPGTKAGGGARGHQTPTTERSEEAGVQIHRTGSPPALPAVSAPQKGDSPCGYKVDVPALRAISDFPLNSRGLGKSSPVILTIDGAPLQPHAFPDAFEERCAGAFRHAGTVVLFSPPEGTDPDSATLELVLDPAVPMPRGDDGRPMYWVYPGTALSVEIPRWDPSWGEPTATLTALVTGDGKATFRVGGEHERGGPVAIEETLDGEGPFRIEIRSPQGGPYVLLDVLTVGNPDNAVVISGGRAWRPSSP